MDIRPVIENYSPPLKIISFVVIVLVSLLFTSLAGLVLGTLIFGPDVAQNAPTLKELADPATIAQLRYFQLISQLALFIFPVIIFIYMVTRERRDYLPLRMPSHRITLPAALAVMIIALPLINWLVTVNMQLSLPESLSRVEEWMKQGEESAARITSAFLGSGNTFDFIINLLMIAVIPAVGEELVFRGILLRLFREWTKNIHVSIVITALLFSFIHFQFYGFLPRFLMGVLFGYMVYWSGSLWLPMLAHFINNVTAVIVAFIAAKGLWDVDFNTFGSSSESMVVIWSAVSVGLIVFFMWMKRIRRISEVPDNL